ncbi:MAG: hypothetical protein ACRCYY_07760 [Trueperaceae bacterium]
MYEPNKLLVMGGGPEGSVTNTATTVSLGSTVTATNTMSSARKNLNATLLADGKVFVNGGNTSGANFDDTTSVYTTETWNPSDGSWTLGVSAQKPRNYHSVSLLLPDATVWTAGGGGCAVIQPRARNQLNAELYYPPYLFKTDSSGLLAT